VNVNRLKKRRKISRSNLAILAWQGFLFSPAGLIFRKKRYQKKRGKNDREIFIFNRKQRKNESGS
jgi:hypothetical protein